MEPLICYAEPGEPVQCVSSTLNLGQNHKIVANTWHKYKHWLDLQHKFRIANPGMILLLAELSWEVPDSFCLCCRKFLQAPPMELHTCPISPQTQCHSLSAYVTGFAKRDLFANFMKIELGSLTSTPTDALYCYQKLNHCEHWVMRNKLHKTVHTQSNPIECTK